MFNMGSAPSLSDIAMPLVVDMLRPVTVLDMDICHI